MGSDAQALASQLLRPLQSLKLDAEYKENMFALAQAKIALDTVESVLLHQKIHSQQLRIDLRPTHGGETIAKVLADLRQYLNYNNVDYELHIQQGLPALDADSKVLDHAFRMLCYAAITLSEPGSVLRIHLSRADHNTNALRLTVASPRLNFDNVVLHEELQDTLSSALETSQALFLLLGAELRKTHISNARGFGASIRMSKQLTLV